MKQQSISGSDLAEAVKTGGTNFQNLLVKGEVDLRGLKRTTSLRFTRMSFLGDLLLEKANLGRLSLEKVNFPEGDEKYGIFLAEACVSEVNIREVNVSGAINAIGISVADFHLDESSADTLDFRSSSFSHLASFSGVKTRWAFFDAIKAANFGIYSRFEVEERVSLTAAKVAGEFVLSGLSVGGHLDLTDILFEDRMMRFEDQNTGFAAKVGEGVVCGTDPALALKCMAFFCPKGTSVSADFGEITKMLRMLCAQKPSN